MMSRTNQLKEALNAIYNLDVKTALVIEQYFSKDYEQLVNGESKQLKEFIAHVDSQKQNLTEIHFDFKETLASDNAVFAIYYPRGKNHQGETIEAEVIAYYRFVDDKIAHCHGQVQLLTGKPSDVDMANN